MRVWRWTINWSFDASSCFIWFYKRLNVFLVQRGIFVAGLREEIVNSAEQVFELIESGEGLSSYKNDLSFVIPYLNRVAICVFITLLISVNRHFGETNMNARSSRSHTIFRMVCLWVLCICFCYLILPLCQSILANRLNAFDFYLNCISGYWKQGKWLIFKLRWCYSCFCPGLWHFILLVLILLDGE